MLVSIGEAAQIIGVSITTLRRWEKQGLFKATLRTKGHHRRYSLKDLETEFQLHDNQKKIKQARKTICYARVSSYDQKLDLKRQVSHLRRYCTTNKLKSEVIKDLGSGINFKKRGLKKLLTCILNNQVDKVILTHKDRLVRFGYPLIELLCSYYNVELVVLEKVNLSFNEEIARDVIEIMTVMCARIYGKRSHQYAA